MGSAALKRLLIITPEFPPSTTVGGKRAAKLAIGTGEFGWRPHVLTMPEGCYGFTDELSVSPALREVPTHRVACRSIWLHGEQWRQSPPGLGRLAAMAIRGLAKATEPLVVDKYLPWSVLAASRGVRVVQREHIDLIWATCPPLASADLAYRIWRRTGTPYVVDFRDVLSRSAAEATSRRSTRFFRRQELVVSHAAAITYVAPHQWQALVDGHPILAEKPSRLVTNWFEQADADACPPQQFNRPTILHAGKLYRGARRIDGVCQAMALLAEQTPDGQPCPQLLHLNPEGVGEGLHRYVTDMGLGDLVQLKPAACEPKFRSYCRGSDVLLLIVGHNTGITEHSRTIPATLYEYFAARRPILVIGPPDTEAGRMVTAARRGLAAADDDPLAIAQALGILLDPRKVSEQFDLTDEAVEPFGASAVVAELCGLFDRISCDS